METAGNVVIQISANAQAFEAALAKAQQQATAFDATISAKLNGAGVSSGLAKIAGLVEQTNGLLAKMTGTATPAAAAMQKMNSAAKDAASSTNLLNRALDDVQTSARPVAAAMEDINTANRLSVALETQRSTVLGESRQALVGQAGAMRAAATETEHLGSASRLGSAQMQALGHSARSAIETLALGVSPTQALMQQMNHLSFAMSGPQGLIAASAGARAAFAGWVTSIPGILTTAGVAAVGGLTAYVLATRNSIQSVDQVLSEHKALIDEIAGAYPEAAKAAASYAEAAKRIPQSVASADIQDKIKENQKTLADTLGFLTTQLQGVSQEFGLVGEKSAEAFGDLANIGKSGAADAADRIAAALGRMRIDPTLSENARQFARDFQDAANKAAELQDKLNEKSAIKNIVDNNAKAISTLFGVSQGFKDVQSSASGADATIAKMFGTLNGGSTGQFGVERSLQSTLAGFQQVDTAVQESRRNQLSEFLDLGNQLRATTEQADQLKQAIASAAGPDNVKLFFNDVSGIKDANGELQRSVDTVNRLFDAMNTGNATTRSVFEGIDMIRATLVRDGFGVDAVNKFIDSLVQTRMQLDTDTAHAKQLNAAVQAIRDKTVTITLVTRRVGTGTQSIYDVPGGTVGVTRYGGDPNAPSGPSMQSYTVPIEGGYGSQGGVGSGSTGVTVTRFGGTRAGGGPVAAGLPYWVGEHGPELVVPSGAANIIPNAQSLSLVQSLGASQEQDKLTQAITGTAANTQKTAQLLDEIKTAAKASSSSFSGSSSGGGSGGYDTNGLDAAGHTAAQNALFDQVFKAYQSNYAAFHASGIIGYGLDGLSATPREIAANIAYGGLSPLGSGPTPYQQSVAQSGATMAAIANQNIKAGGLGFATGGMIDSGDTQKVEFFKNPNEKVIIARPDQFNDVRSGQGSSEKTVANDSRPISIYQTHNWNGNAPPSKDSMAELRRQTALAVRDAVRSINGR